MAKSGGFITRILFGCISLVLLLTGIWFCGCCPETGTVFEWKYRYRIKVGMTLHEVESILGPGTECSQPPQTADGPVIRGEKFYYWKHGNGSDIWIGLREGKVYDKWFWAMPLF